MKENPVKMEECRQCPYWAAPLFGQKYCTKEGRITTASPGIIGTHYWIPKWCPLPDVVMTVPIWSLRQSESKKGEGE